MLSHAAPYRATPHHTEPHRTMMYVMTVHNMSTVYKNLSATAQAGGTDRLSQYTNHPVRDTLLQLSWAGHRVWSFLYSLLPLCSWPSYRIHPISGNVDKYKRGKIECSTPARYGI
jgi:hypothetical protein